ncbi:MAG: acyl-CoA desaturase [Bacteroidota bacterium]|nr:acyl-CoA desaturase [Bacteroidota bacterium]
MPYLCGRYIYMAAIKFTSPNKTDFYKVLTERVENYFEVNKISKHGDYRMVLKTLVMFSLYFMPYALILSNAVSIYGMWLCTVVMGLGLAGIGMAVMHDANHGAYSSQRWLNKLLGFSLDLVGGNSFNWKVQHNIQHHTFTNIHGHDWDIRDRMNLRFTPAVKRNGLHRFQVVYAFILYGLQTFFWVLVKDFIQLIEVGKDPSRRMSNKETALRFVGLIGAKSLYVLYILVLPAIVLHLAWWQLLIGFMTLHVVAGLVLTTVFQLAHVVEDAAFPAPDAKGVVRNDWAIHQMQTTANFAPRNKLLSFYVGGLNYQVEHHLFQRVCHVHYPAIAPIVQKTAAEYGVPYLSNDTLSAAIASHVRLLKTLGVRETLAMASEF